MPSRRELIQMTPAEIRDYLQSEKTIILVSNGANGYPHPMPMWFYTDTEGCVYCTTFAKSQKVLNLQRDPKVTLLVESGEEYSALKSVMIYADTEIIEDFEIVSDVLTEIGTKGRNVSDADRAKVRASVAGTASKRVVLKFTPRKTVSWDHAKLGGKY